MQRLSTTLFVLLALAGCASSGGGEEGEEAPRRSGTSISVEELMEQPQQNVLDAIRRLRPRWVSSVNMGSFGGAASVKFYIDGLPESVSNVRRIRADEVTSIRFLDGRRATTRFGSDHGEGAIMIRTR